jgi:hypothetical protein
MRRVENYSVRIGLVPVQMLVRPVQIGIFFQEKRRFLSAKTLSPKPQIAVGAPQIASSR